MNRFIKRIAAIILVAIIAVSVYALADNVISTSVVMRITRVTQSAVVDAGEDLAMEINIDGVTPTAFQWYKDDAAIEGANQKVYTIVNAKVEDSGVYRMEAFDENGKMLVSMDISARVVDRSVPKSGDTSMPVGAAIAGLVIASCALLLMFRRKARA